VRRPWVSKKRLLRFSLFLFALYLAFCACAAKFLVDITLRQPHPGSMALAPPPWLTQPVLGGQPQEVSVEAQDGATLRAWYFVHSAITRNAVIVLHGLGDTRKGMSGQAELFLRHGYNVLMPDSRAHGASGGELATFGILEADDVHRWVSWLQERLPKGGCVFGSGVSMGAGIVLQAAARKSEPRFCGVIAEAPYASFREIAYDRIGQPFNLGPWFGMTVGRPIIEFGMIYARSKYKVNMEEASPMTALRNSSVPVLLIAGLADDNIPIRHSRMIHELNPGVILWEVPGVGHGSAISDAPEDYERHVMEFVSINSEPTLNKAPSGTK
jgi:pimeloyl-ACP methyl ester carboxylesterase